MASTVDPGSGTEGALDVVIVSYRSKELLRRCLQALREHPPRCPMTIQVVDNASEDGTVEMLARDFPEVRLVANTVNVGFACACNQAITLGDAPYVLVLNPDTRVQTGCLDRMLALMEREHRCGIAGCRLIREDGTDDHAAKRSFPTVAGALGHFAGLADREWAPVWLRQYRAPSVAAGPVDAVNGAFMMIRRPALEEVGGFDEGYWMYMEDLDLCYRFAQAGWTTWYEPSATAVHVKWGSSGKVRSPRLTMAFHRGMYRFYKLHVAPGHGRARNALVYAGIGLKLALTIGKNLMLRAASGHRSSSP